MIHDATLMIDIGSHMLKVYVEYKYTPSRQGFCALIGRHYPEPPEIDLLKVEVEYVNLYDGERLYRSWLDAHGFNLDRQAWKRIEEGLNHLEFGKLFTIAENDRAE